MLKIMFGSIGLVLLATPLLVSADMASDLQACAVQPATTDSLTRCVTGLLAQIAAMETSVISDTSSGSSASGGATAGATSCVSISNFLSAGDTDKNSDDEVTKLQQFLVSQGASIYPEGLVTGYFGPATERALKRFQTAQGIVSSGSPETTGYGATGPQTRKRIAEMTGCGSAGQTTTSAQTTPPPNFSASPTSGPAPLEVTFTYTVNQERSCDGGLYSLDFGDGSSNPQLINPAGTCQSYVQYTTHTYSGSGKYTARLYIPIHDCGQVGTLCAEQTLGTATVTVGGQQDYRIGLVYPDAGQTFSPGDTINVQWKYTNLAGTVVNVTLDSVDAQRHLATYVPTEKGGATITLPVTDSLGTLREGPATLSVWVTKISDGDPRSVRSAIPITIRNKQSATSITVTAPNGGEQWRLGETHDITWVSSLVGKTASIYLFPSTVSSSGSGGCFVGAVPASVGKYPFYFSTTFNCSNIPNVAGGLYKIVLKLNVTEFGDDSDAPFSINAPVPATPTASIT